MISEKKNFQNRIQVSYTIGINDSASHVRAALAELIDNPCCLGLVIGAVFEVGRRDGQRDTLVGKKRHWFWSHGFRQLRLRNENEISLLGSGIELSVSSWDRCAWKKMLVTK